MSRLNEIRARVEAYAEGTTVREDRVYLLALVDEAREIIRGYERERTEPPSLESSALWWLIRVERETSDNG